MKRLITLITIFLIIACFNNAYAERIRMSGGGGGAGLDTAAGDARYLRLDNKNAGTHSVLQTDKYVFCATFTSAGINACIDKLGAEGGEVYLPEGTYACTTSIVMDVNNITLTG